MKTMTNWFKEVAVCLSMVTIFCACAMAYPATLSEKTRFGELKALINLLRKELHFNDNSIVKNDIGMTDLDISGQDTMHPGTMIQSQDSQSKPLLSSLLLKNDDDPNTYDVKKRQGSWDYDYGLGGGRFGKRGYWADYSLGGGRFGRDTDHVSNMADDRNLDFEDTME